MFWFPLDIFPEVGLLCQKVDQFLIFWDISILLSTVAVSICISPTVQKDYISLHPHQHLLFVDLLMVAFWLVWSFIWSTATLIFISIVLLISYLALYRKKFINP